MTSNAPLVGASDYEKAFGEMESSMKRATTARLDARLGGIVTIRGAPALTKRPPDGVYESRPVLGYSVEEQRSILIIQLEKAFDALIAFEKMQEFAEDIYRRNSAAMTPTADLVAKSAVAASHTEGADSAK